VHKTSRDAYFTREDNIFRVGTSKVEKVLELNEYGQFVMSDYVNKITGSHYVLGGAQPSDEFAITFNGKQYSGSDCNWQVTDVATSELSQGELEAIITLQNDVLRVERHYVAYPGVGVIQEWTVYENISGKDGTIDRPRIFIQRLMHNEIADIDFLYMTGGGNFTGSTILKQVKIEDGYVKDFDSQGPPEMMEVDGAFANKLHPRFNGTAMWFEFFALRNRAKN